ncbi:MAG: DeoR/GlpR transcriptional regulator [Chloroflexi bacterium]|nr:DeoR/GlpR transcriptional regulator [Chloroflexota bacterium]
MSVNGREQQIFDLLCQHGSLTIQQLSEFLGVSPSSVRRDLGDLREHRFIQRTHGGATLFNVVSYTPLPIHSPSVDPNEARTIAHRALELIGRGDVIGLSGGRFCTELALHMRLHEGITVVTNAVNVAAELVALPGIQVIVTGGTLDPRSFELVGQVAQQSLNGIRMHRYFVGTDGITVEHGMTNHNEAATLVAREFIKHSDQTIVLADSSKFKRSNLSQVVPISEISCIVTTDRVPKAIISQFEQAGVKCLVEPCKECVGEEEIV